MSVFSKIMTSKKAAKEHRAKAAKKEKPADAAVKVPYKHIPTHAAIDALSGAPSSWKSEDRPKIKEQHKRRSQMIVSQTGSNCSTSTYLNAAARPNLGPLLPRATSYSSYNSVRSGDVSFTNDTRQKRHQSTKGHLYIDSEESPEVSSGNSTSSRSSQKFEPANLEHLSQRPTPISYTDKDIFQRLHTSTTRKLGEAPVLITPRPLFSMPTNSTTTTTATIISPTVKPNRLGWRLLGKGDTVGGI